MTNITKLAQFFDNELKSDVKNVIITCDRSGVYELFGKYVINQDSLGFKVRGITTGSTLYLFSTLKNAVSWCTLQNEGRMSDAGRLYYLDSKICSIEFDIVVHKKMLESASEQNRLIYRIKLQEDTYKRRAVLKEINSYINSSKRLQDVRFSKKPKFFGFAR